RSKRDWSSDVCSSDLHAEIAGAEQTIRRSPRDVEARNFLATRYMRAGRVQEAIAHLRAALEVDGKAADVHANLGIALQSAGEGRSEERRVGKGGRRRV